METISKKGDMLSKSKRFEKWIEKVILLYIVILCRTKGNSDMQQLLHNAQFNQTPMQIYTLDISVNMQQYWHLDLLWADDCQMSYGK